MKEFPEHKVVSTLSLIPYAMNSRTHSEHQIAQIAASIKEFGFLNPVIVDGDNGIIAGHGRVMAAMHLCMEQVPVVEAKHLTDAQKKAFVIADNRIALNAGWDYEILRSEFDSLDLMDFDQNILGFDIGEIDLLAEIPEEKDAPEDFVEFNDDIDTEHRCPKCNYEWSGKVK